MAFKTLFPNGLGESLADSLAVNAPFYTTGSVWYVHATTGTDAATPAGQNRMKPLASLAQAFTNAEEGDVIVLMDGHTETRTTTLTINKRVLIMGGGESNGKPTVKLTLDHASNRLFSIAEPGVELRNIWFEENVQANSSSRILVTGDHFRMRGCYFECGGTDEGAALEIGSGASGVSVESTTFVSTGTSRADQPAVALTVSSSGDSIAFRQCVLDGGTVGFSGYWAMNVSGAPQNLVIEDMSLLRGADILVTSGTTIHVGGISGTESALIQFQEGE